MRAFSILFSARLLFAGVTTAAADTRTESWLNGLAMELNQTRVASNATLRAMRCCTDEKAEIEKRFTGTFNAIAKAQAAAQAAAQGGRFLCRRMDFVDMNLGMLKARMAVLVLALNAPRNSGAFTQADRARFQSITDRVAAMEASAEAKHKQLGC